jgi:NAD(P)-dependent dehydrogenase (short-subunit alcohol dehydrogenase family)
MSHFASYPSLRDRVVFISGGGSGIGAAIVEHFAEQGSKTAFVDIDDAASTALVQKISAAGHPAPLYHKCDVRDVTAYQAVIAEVGGSLGAITVLVNNAARDDRHSLEEVTPAYWDERIAVNLRHQFFAIQTIAPGMKKAGGGSIVNFSSVSYHTMTANLAVYQAAKAAVIGMTRGLARDLGPDHIRLNSITPGWIMTQRQIDLWLTPEAEAGLMQAQCLKEKLYPPDIARMALWLGADDSRLVTAQNFLVEGGRMRAWGRPGRRASATRS